MGYYTTFTVNVDSVNSNDYVSVINAIQDISGYEVLDGEIKSVKWYDYRDHIEQISVMFPAAFITVDGVGEERDDHWRLYACNGNTEKVTAVVTFPEPTIERPKMRETLVHVTLCGVDIPIEVEHVDGMSAYDVYELAKKELKSLL